MSQFLVLGTVKVKCSEVFRSLSTGSESILAIKSNETVAELSEAGLIHR